MNKNVRKLKVALGLLNLEEYITKEGETITVEDGMTTAAAGEHELEDGRILTVAEDGTATVADAPVAEEEVVETEEEVAEDPMVAMQAALDALNERIAALEADKQNLSSENEQLKEKLSAAETLPADKKIVLSASSAPVKKSKGQLALEALRAAQAGR